MSDTNLTQKTPLWKQLLGAAIGATAAFVLYQGYAFTSDHLQAVLMSDPAGHIWPSGTIESPTAFETISSSSSSAASQNVRPLLGPFGSIRGLKKFFLFGNSSSSAAAPAIAAAVSSSASSMIAVQPSIDSVLHMWPTSTVTTPAEAVVPTPPAPPPRVRRIPAFRPAPVNGQQVDSGLTEVSSSESSSEVSMAAQSGSSDSAAINAPSPPPVEPMPVPTVVALTQKQKKLPKSGFGLDVLAVTALGAVIGRRRAKARM